MTLPTWFVIGAPKAGTTALAEWFRDHPGAYVPPQKEVGFFDARWHRGWDWLRDQYAAAGPDQRAGDATPSYLYDTQALDRIAEAIPDARIVVLLREPAARVWSHAWYFRYLGLDPREPADTVMAELRDPEVTIPNLGLSYLDMSTYVRYLPEVVARFGAEQVLVEFSEDLREDPDGTYARICRHVGIAPVVAPRREANVGRVARSYRLQRLIIRMGRRLPRNMAWKLIDLNQKPGSYPRLPDELRGALRTRLAEPNRRLAAWLERDLPAGWSR